MKRLQFVSHLSHLVIVHDLNFKCITGLPYEADSELIIHADAVLTFPISLERFQPVTRWYPKVLQRLRTMEHPQLSERYPMHTLREAFRSLTAKKPLRIGTGETLNHDGIL